MFKHFFSPKKIIEEKTIQRGALWIHGEALSSSELDELIQTFHLNKSLLSDAYDIYEVPRLEFEDALPYLFIRYPYKDGSEIQTYPLLCIILPELCITITKDPFPLYDFVLQRIAGASQLDPRAILISLFREINAAYSFCLTAISKDIRRYQKKEGNITNADILRFVNIENTLYDLSTSLLRMDRIYEMLRDYEIFTKTEEENDAFEDIILEGRQMEELLKVNIRTITNLRDAYTIILSNNLNRIIKMFTSFTVILTIPVLIASFYGMNVPLPFQEHPIAFFGIMTICLVFIVGMLWVFIKNDWI